MAKRFFMLQGGYEGLKGRKIIGKGRLVLYEIINDGPRYWLLLIKNYQRDVDGSKCRWFIGDTSIPSEAAGKHFLSKDLAFEWFDRLSPLFPEQPKPERTYADAARMAELSLRKKQLQQNRRTL